MNAVIETIMGRRSVRWFEDKPIPREILDTIIAAGNAAPSGANVQAWRFVVVESGEYRKKLADLVLPRYKKWLTNAPQSLKDVRKEIDVVSVDPVYYSAPVVIFVIGSGMMKDTDSSMVC